MFSHTTGGVLYDVGSVWNMFWENFHFFVVIVQVIIWYSPTSLIQSTIFSFKLITMPACQGLPPILNGTSTLSILAENILDLKKIFYISELFRLGKSWSPKFGFDISNYYWRMTYKHNLPIILNKILSDLQTFLRAFKLELPVLTRRWMLFAYKYNS